MISLLFIVKNYHFKMPYKFSYLRFSSFICKYFACDSCGVTSTKNVFVRGSVFFLTNVRASEYCFVWNWRVFSEVVKCMVSVTTFVS